MDEPDEEDVDSNDKESKKEGSPDKKQAEDKPAGEGEDGIKVSDVFLNMNLSGEKDQTMNSRKKDEDDDEVDFDRDDD